MEQTLRLRDSISKYLKFMDLIQSSSPLTLKHYSLDLCQTFEADNISHISNDSWSEEALMAQVRRAFNRWAGLSLATRNRKAATLKSFFGWAFREGLIDKDLSLQITCPRVPRKIPHFLSVDEALTVLKGFERDRLPAKDKALFLLLYGGGLRVSEACNLQWQNVLISQRALRVIGKGSKERVVALPVLAFKALSELQKITGDEVYVFGKTPLNTRTAYEMVRQSGLRTGLLKPLHPHALRHSFATHLLTSGANLRTLQELLGHESLQATEKYTHLGIDQLARTLEKMHPLGNKK